MAHSKTPAAPAIEPEWRLPFCMEGLSFVPPGLWDLTQFRFGEQHFRDGGLFAQFDDLLRERLIFRWYNKQADPKRMTIAYIGNLSDEVKRNLPQGIAPPEIVPGPFQEELAPGLNAPIVKCVFRSGDLFGRIYTFPWPDPAVKRTVLICLAYSAAENNRIVEDWEEALLGSLSWQAPGSSGTRMWSVGGLRCDAPGYLMLWETEVYAGQFKMLLRPDRRYLKEHPGEELVLFRAGLAKTTLENSSLHAVALNWLKTVQGPRSPDFSESPDRLEVRSTPGNPVSKLAARAKRISRRARGDFLLGAVRQRPDFNALVGVFWFSHRPLDPARLEVLEKSLTVRGLEAHPAMPVQAGLPSVQKMPAPEMDAKGRPVMTRAWQWRTIVLRNPSASIETIHDGLRLKLPVQPTKMTSVLRRFSGMGRQALPDKIVDLDRIGAELWEQFDGKADLWKITSAFSQKYRLSIRESERLIWQHLQNMVKRGIVGLAIPKYQEQEALFENAGT
ncbi:MAG: hypothetical protein ACREJ2_04405 [Planctomycetota bacterium]